MQRVRLNFATRLWLVGTIAVLLPVATMLLAQDIRVSLAAAVAAAVLLRSAFGRLLRPLTDLGVRVAKLSAQMAEQETLIRAQNSLALNIGLLREALHAHGEPRREGGKLYFGSKLINDNFDEVDKVKESAGGNATVFLDDTRVSTNVQKPDGSRAVGTKLAPGAAHEAVFRHGKTYRGEAEILGVPHLTIYEPIMSNGSVIGILYVGVKKAECRVAIETDGGDEIRAIERAVRVFEEAAVARAEAEREAVEQRAAAEDSRRQNDEARKSVVADQRAVVQALSSALERLSAGDLTQAVAGRFPPEYEKLKRDFNATLEKLRDTLASIAAAVQSMQQGSAEISAAAADLSRRTEQQAATLEETAATLDQVTEKVRRTAEGAENARKTVSLARSDAERSGEVVNEAVAAMTEIDASARKVSQIIGVIDDIAFQTNLLALNAGVEAARAGDSGKGFAVVASEIRTLAHRSAEAAREIKALISASTQQVNSGVGLVAATGQALAGLAHHVAEIDKIVNGIAASARDQASGLQQVNAAVKEVDKATQQNAAMAEESTAASQSLAREAEHLAETVARFRIAASDGAGELPSRPAAPVVSLAAVQRGSGVRTGRIRDLGAGQRTK